MNTALSSTYDTNRIAKDNKVPVDVVPRSDQQPEADNRQSIVHYIASKQDLVS